MSMQTWEIQGYGIVSDGFDAKKYIELVNKISADLPEEDKIFGDDGKTEYLKLISSCVKYDDPEEYLSDIEDYRPLRFLADYLNYKYNCVGFESPSIDEDGNLAVLYIPCYPWEGKDGDHSLSQEMIDKIFAEIAKGLEWNTEPDFLTLYYFG